MSQHPEWLATLIREAKVRAGLVVYGNTRDLFWSGAGADYVTLPALLTRTLDQFPIRATWDRVDGLRFESDDHARRWDDGVARGVGAGARGGGNYDLGDDKAPAAPVVRPIELQDLIPEYRTLARSGGRPLLVIDWSHLLVTQPAHPDLSEREWILQLGKALVGEPHQRIDSDRLEATGLVVVVSASLGAVPPVLYQGEPRVRLLPVPAPGRAERRAFFDRHVEDLRVETPRPASGSTDVPPRTATVETMADLSDQLTTADLRQVVALSRSLETPIHADRLMNLYRFGDQRSPWEELSQAKLKSVDKTLRNRVIGQDGAVDHVGTMIIRAWLGLAGLQHSARRSKPKGTLFFVGPTGVGKTELAKACAEFLFGDESACIRFDMSEYNHEHSDQRLVGAPPGYVGFEEGGQLTNAVRARPFSVLLFDEIEKAHGRVLDKFLQILEDGRLTDGRGETAWFSETVIIFTSNIGAAQAAEDATNGGSGGVGAAGAAGHEYDRRFRTAVEQHFVRKLERPELLNRLGENIVVFRPIHEEKMRRGILEKKLQPLVDHMRDRYSVQLRFDDGVVTRLMDGARADQGGRGLLNSVEKQLLNPLARFLFERLHQLSPGRAVVARLDGNLIEFEVRE